jgi:aspartate/methionine/tyrosine aminotransferase
VLKRSLLEGIVKLASEKGIIVFSDEVYRPIFHSISPVDPEFPPSVLNLGYSKVVVTGSLSKAYSLAGIRVGWIASREPELVEKIAAIRHYTTISVSQLDEQVAAFALDHSTVHNLLSRNLQLAKKNLEIMEKFMIKNDDVCSWVKPVAGTTTFIKFARDGKPVDSVELCKQLVEKAGVLAVPGNMCFGDRFLGYVRIGYVQETEALQSGLAALQNFLKLGFDNVPLA